MTREEKIALLENASKTEDFQKSFMSREEKIAALEAATPPVIEEKEHPDVGILDRFVAKQATSPDQAIRSLKSKYPNLEFRAQDNRVLIRSPGQASWNTLDPQTGIDFKNPAELLKDVLDITPDVAQGALEAGAVAGGAGIGGIPGALAAGATAGAGLEALKQKTFFPEDTLDKDALKYAAISGAAAPLLFGSGVATPALVKQGAMSAIKEKGVIGAGLSALGEKGVPKLASLLSANKITPDEFRYAAKNPAEIKAIADDPMPLLKQETQNVKTRMAQESDRLWKKLLKYAGGTKTKVDVTNVAYPLLQKRFDAAEAAIRLPSGAAQGVVKEYDSLIAHLFGDAPKNIVTAKNAHIMKRHMQDAINRLKSPTDVTSVEVKQSLYDTKKALDSAIDSTFKGKGKKGYRAANAEYHKFAKIRTYLESKLGKPGTNEFAANEKLLQYMLKNKSEIPYREKILAKVDRKLGTNLRELPLKIGTANKLANAAKMPMGLPGSVSVLGGLAYAVSPEDSAWSQPALLALGLSGVSPWAFKKYLQTGYAAKGAADKLLGSNLRKQAMMQSAWNMFGNNMEE